MTACSMAITSDCPESGLRKHAAQQAGRACRRNQRHRMRRRDRGPVTCSPRPFAPVVPYSPACLVVSEQVQESIRLVLRKPTRCRKSSGSEILYLSYGYEVILDVDKGAGRPPACNSPGWNTAPWRSLCLLLRIPCRGPAFGNRNARTTSRRAGLSVASGSPGLAESPLRLGFHHVGKADHRCMNSSCFT